MAPGRMRHGRRLRRALWGRLVVGLTALAVAVTGIVLMTAPIAAAATSFTWDGGGGTDTTWSNRLNWAGDVVPSGTVSIFLSGGGTTTFNLSSSSITVSALSVNGTWQMAGGQIPVGQIDVATGSNVTFAGGFTSQDTYLDMQASATATLSGKLTISRTLEVTGPTSATVTLTGTVANSVFQFFTDGPVVNFNKPAGTAAARLVAATSTGTINWQADRQLQALVAPTSTFPRPPQPDIRAEGGHINLNGHTEVVDEVVLNGGGVLDLGGGDLTAEDLWTSISDGGRGDLVNGTFRFNAHPQYNSYDLVTFSNSLNPDDLHIGAKVVGSAPLVVEGDTSQAPVVRFADAASYTGPLTVKNGTVCAAKGYGGTVTQSGGTYIDERQAPCTLPTPKAPPQPPTGLTATPGDAHVTLSWTAPTDTGSASLKGYVIYRSVGDTGSDELTRVGAGVTTYTDSGLTNGQEYGYWVAAYSDDGQSDTVGTYVTPQASPRPPGPPTLTALAGDGAARLEWTTPADPGNLGLTGYKLYRSTSSDSRGNEIYSGEERAFLDAGIENGKTYYYTVIPQAGETEGEPSPPVTVTPSVDSGVLSLDMGQSAPAYPGRDTTLQLTATNKADAMLDGPFVATIMLPGNTFTVSSSGGGGWVCGELRSLGGQSLLTCTNPAPVGAMADVAPLPITLAVPSGTARATYPISYSMAAGDRAASSSAPYQLIVEDPKPAHLTLGIAVPGALTTDPQDLTLQVKNDGAGPTISGLTVRMPVPAGVTLGVLSTESFWTCSKTTTVTCTSTEPLASGAAAPPITIATTATPTDAATTIVLNATVSSTDPIGTVSASSTAQTTSPVVPKPSFSVVPSTENDGNAFRLAVQNTGGAPATGQVTVLLRLPSSFVTVQALSDFDAWSCSQPASSPILRCVTAHPVTINAGDSLSGPLLSAQALYAYGGAGSTTPITLSGQYAGQATATLVTTGGVTYRSPAAAVPVPVFGPAPAPALSTEAQFKDSPLFGQHHSSVTFTLKGNANSDYNDRAPLVALLPKSLTLDGTAIPSMAGYPAGTPAPACEIHHGTYAGGYTSAIVCFVDHTIPASSILSITVPFTSAAEIGGTVSAVAGIVKRPAGLTTAAQITQYAWDRIGNRGVAALASSSEAKANGITFTASAGPPQRVDAGVLGSDGTVTPTKVVLGGSSSADTATPLTYGWVQTAGPKVTWLPDTSGNAGTGPTFPSVGGSVLRPDVTGRTPSFKAPAVTEHTELVFQLNVTDGSAVATSVTTVAIDPLADNPPSVTSVKLTDAGGTVLNPSVAPTAGQELQLRYSTADAEHDPVAVVPSVVRPGELRNTTFTPVAGAPAGQSWFSFHWPAGVAQAVIEAVLTDGKTDAGGHAVSSRHSLVIGPDPAPLGITVAPPANGIDPGGSLSLAATLTNPVVGSDSTTVTWTQLSGPASTLTPTGATATLQVPPTASPGDSITVQALARRGSGSSAPVATATVTVAVVTLPSLGLGPVRTTGGALPASVAPGSSTPLTIAVSGGRAPYTYAWQVVSGGGSLAGGSTSTATLTAPSTPGLTSVAVLVTDASGATARQTAAVPVGSVPSGTKGAQGCDAGGPLRTIYDAAAGLAGSDHVAVTFGALRVDLGPKSTLLGSATACSDQTLTIAGGAASVSGIGFTGVNGTVNAQGITISSATVALPGAWRLTGVQLHDVRFGFADYALTGSLTASTLPVVASTGAVTQASTTLTLGADRVTLAATARLAGAAVSLAGVYCFTGGAACTSPPAGVVGPVQPGAFSIHATVGDLSFLDHTLTGGGDLTLAADGTLTGAVELVWTGAASGDLGINEVRLRWSDVGLRFHAGANLGGHFTASLDGDYLDSDDWSADVSGGLAADWTPAPGLALTKYNATTHTGTGVDGSVAMKAGHLSWAVTLNAGASWSSGPLTVKGVSLTLASGSAAPAGCGLNAQQQGKLYLDLKGIAEVSWGASGGSGGTKVSLNIETCIVPDVGWTLTTTTPLSGVQITDGLDLTGVTFTAAHRSSPDQTSYVLNATGTAFGVSGAVTLALLTPAAGDASFLADMSVDLGDLGLPVSGQGHLLYASRPVADLGAIPGLDGGFATHPTDVPGAGGCAGATPGNPLDGLPVPTGFTALANFQMPTSLCGFLNDHVGVAVAPSLAVSVSMSGTPVITASISAGPQGHQIFSTSNGTSLTLRRIKLSISLGGSFGILADADLSLPRPDATGPTDVSVLQLGAGATIQLVGVPSITVVLQKTGDAWQNAFGVTGLDLGDLAIQGGIVFSAIPTPSIGFGAQILDLPTSWKNSLGIVTPPGGKMEPVQLVLNISLANPILDIRLGVQNGQDFMRPLHAISSSIEQALTIDYAQLTIAPFGGDVGPFHYDPGFHLGFAAKVVGVTVDVRADLDITSGAMSAHANIGAFGFGPLSFDKTTFDFAVSPASGGMTIGLSGGTHIASVTTTATATVQAKVVTSRPTFKVDFDARVGNLNFGPIGLTNFELFAHTSSSSATSILNPLNGIVFGGTATLNVLSVPLTVYGTVTLNAYGGITGADLLVTAGKINVGPATIGGTGCNTSALGYLPAGTGATVPTDGPCLQVSIHPGSSNPYYISANGRISVLGFAAAFSGTIDNTGIAVMASVRLGSVATASVSGRLWAGTGINGTQKDYDVNAGKYVTVHNGDFRVHGLTSVGLLGFNTSLTFDLGNIGGSQWAKGYANLDALTWGHSPVAASATLVGSFGHASNGSVTWDLGGSGTVYVWGYTVANASLHFTQNGFSVNGSLNAAGIITANVNVTMSVSNGVFRFNLGGGGSIHLLGLNIGAYVSIGNLSGPVVISARADADIAALHVHASAWFSTGGAVCISGSANIGFGDPHWGDLVNGSASFCTQAMNGMQAGIHASFWVLNMIGVQADWTTWDRFTAVGGVNLPGFHVGGVSCHWYGCYGAEASFSGYAYIAVSSYPTSVYWGGWHNVGTGISFASSANLRLHACLAFCFGVDVGASVSFNPTKFCGSYSGATACMAFNPLKFSVST